VYICTSSQMSLLSRDKLACLNDSADKEANYDKEAPTSVGAKQTPSFVLILCVAFVTGSTQAASLVSRVVRPGWIVSKIFFLGLSCDSGALSS